MSKQCLWLLVLVGFSNTTADIYGPDLTRTDPALASRACQEADFLQSPQIAKAVASGKPDDILQVVGSAMKEWSQTPKTSSLYPSRACLHELVPSILDHKGSEDASSAVWREPTSSVLRFNALGIEYYYYSPDGAWRLSKNPIDLNELASEYLDSRWGCQAFLMMTQLGWRQGGCQEGPDQFRMVIKHGEEFLAKYPDAEVSNSVRLEMANAYATWWNVANMEPDSYTNPEHYKTGAQRAKHRAIKLYEQYLSTQPAPDPKTQKRLKALKENPKGSNTWDYLCEDYED